MIFLIQLNSIPSSDKYWDVNLDNNLFEVYDRIINTDQKAIIQDNEAGTDQANSILYINGKPTREKKAYDRYLSKLETTILEWQDHINKYNELLSENDKYTWIEQLKLILLKKEKAIVDHKILGYKKIIEDAFRKINKTDEIDTFLDNIKNSRNIFEASKKTGILSLNSYLDINFVPYDFMLTSNGWTKLEIDKDELDELYNVANNQKDSFPNEIISIDYDDENIIGVEFEFAIISMQRNWFSVSPISSKFFQWPEAKLISDGEMISNEYLLSAYPKKMVLIKNLKIKINEKIEPDVVDKINQLIRFGPIIMKNQLFVNSVNGTKFIKAINNKETLSSNNIEYYNRKLFFSEKASIINPELITHAARRSIKSETITGFIPKHITVPQTISPLLFQFAKIINDSENLADVVIEVKDEISDKPIYKSAISIIGNNNNIFKEIETNDKGVIAFKLPLGSYTIKIRKDGYSENSEKIEITNINEVSKKYLLKTESITYNSFFLIGMICQKLPKIPKEQGSS